MKKYIPIILPILGIISSLYFAISAFAISYNLTEALAWTTCAIWASTCLLHEIRNFNDGN